MYKRQVLKYSKDGIALVNRKGDEEWNQPYQIKNPIVNTWQDEAVVVADKGGNTIMVMDKKGLKGEMQTALPVERVSVSSQGIVCAVPVSYTHLHIVFAKYQNKLIICEFWSIIFEERNIQMCIRDSIYIDDIAILKNLIFAWNTMADYVVNRSAYALRKSFIVQWSRNATVFGCKVIY